eukprot:TRINITY_DN12800_c0_g1_i1.p1 TRINITY_DN12800_c0_g1~~TRINITY_DN12800_c0_g1_i1.p1  ORF type:complete len:154 (-),score=44.85 TRINITY_DN12800_c0_g1_i1:123-584(-)
MIRRPPRSTLSSSSAASDVYKRQDKVSAAVLEINDSDLNFGFGSGGASKTTTTFTPTTTSSSLHSLGDDAKGVYVSRICRRWRVRTSLRRLRGHTDAIAQYNQLRVLQELVHSQVGNDGGGDDDEAKGVITPSPLSPLSTLCLLYTSPSPRDS